MGFKIIAEEPKIAVYRNFLDQETCSLLIKNLPTSFVESKMRSRIKNYRTSSTSLLDVDSYPGNHILDKLIISLGFKEKDIEPLQIQKYEIGQQYKEHFDALNISKQSELKELKGKKQRKTSLLIFLNSDFEGGETYFPKKDVTIEPETGKLLVFSNTFKNTEFIHPLSSHQGNIVVSGQKLILTSWATKGIPL